jgi:uncharacterized membrane protein YgcG
MSRWSRILKHRSFDVHDVRRALGDAAMTRLEARVKASEQRHAGQIRLCIEAALPWSYLWKHLSARDRAVTMFGKLRVWDTQANNGVLIYLLFAERAIEIVADRGLNAHVTPAQWQALVDAMRAPLGAGRFEEGLNRAIDGVETLLQMHFPHQGSGASPNELPDRPWVG